MRLIAEASNFQGTIKVCWIDGETINLEENSPPPITWHEFSCDKLHREAYAWPKVQPILALEHAACTEIIHLLGNQPGIRLSNNGSVVALDLSNGEPYRRSLAAGLSQESESQLWSLVKCLPSLREFRAGFSGFQHIPDLSELKNLETLDLRGNPGIKLSYLSSVKSLKKLNAAACALEAIPSEIEDLSSLQILLLHKNKIQTVSEVEFPSSLERISLYRNQIKWGILNLSNCREINEINLGANPLNFMTAIIADDVSSLSLRLRYVKDRVKIFWKGGIGTDPAIIYDH
jgi:Leucine-rich repeat (LRR) protein